MNAIVWDVVTRAENSPTSYSIPFAYQEAHPAFDEGFMDYEQHHGCSVNPYEEATDSWYEWNDGFMTAYQYSLSWHEYA